jgi:hypothetical protein
MSEKKYFETEIKKLSRKLSGLSSDIMKEQRMKSDLQKRLNKAIGERNNFSVKVKELEEVLFKIKLSERRTPDIIQQSAYDDSADSECSFKTAFSSIHTNVPLPKPTKSSGQIRTSNLFYDRRVDGSGNTYSRKGKMVWKIKGSTERVEQAKSFLSQPKFPKNNNIQSSSFVKPRMVYSRNNLIRLSPKNTYCSFWDSNDFVQEDFDDRFGIYRVSSCKSTTRNKQGPKFRWVPKVV